MDEANEKKYFEEYYTCPHCLKPLVSKEKLQLYQDEYFNCPHCSKALVSKYDLRSYYEAKNYYCWNCGKEISNALSEALDSMEH